MWVALRRKTKPMAKDFAEKVWVDSSTVKSEIVQICAEQPNAVVIKAPDNRSSIKVECDNEIIALCLVKEVRKQDILIRKQEQQSFLPHGPIPDTSLALSLTPTCLSSILVLYIEASDFASSLKSTLPSDTKLNINCF